MSHEKLKAIRLSQGITQTELAKRLNMDRSYLVKIERGQKKPSLALLERIAAELNVSVKDFF